MRRPVRHAIGAALFSLASVTSGCGPASEPVPPTPPEPASVAADPAPVEPPLPEVVTEPIAPSLDEIPRRDPTQASDNAFSGPDQPPVPLPEDVPIYAEAATVGSMTSPRTGTIVNLTSPDGPEQVAGWYRDELTKRGWKVDKESTTGSQHLVAAFKEGRRATVLIRAGAIGTHILLTVARDG